MCVGQIARAAISPIASPVGRAGMLGGIAGAISAVSRKKKTGPAPPAMTLEPNAALGNSSNFNKWGY